MELKQHTAHTKKAWVTFLHYKWEFAYLLRSFLYKDEQYMSVFVSLLKHDAKTTVVENVHGI